MFKHYFEQIEGVEIGPVISLIIFVGFFIGLGIWLYKISDHYVSSMKNLPLEDEQDDTHSQVFNS
ncbi:MAG: cytochrome C oxidase Cbb3 [Cytophagales bacterium]|nr:cytochrome C oxidase Cbb3 [Cytophagales bacterium]